MSVLPLLLQGSMVAATVLGASGCTTMSLAHADPLEAQRIARNALSAEARRQISEKDEKKILETAKTHGTLVEVSTGSATVPTVITIHGINGAPDSVQPLTDRAIERGGKVMTYAYDDRYSRLTTTSETFSRDLSSWMKSNPGAPLVIEAHSMGSRVTLGALKLLDERGELSGRSIELTLVAPPLEGYSSANAARMLPDFLARAIGGAVPGKDMGTSSDFQKSLENLKLPDSVKTTIYVASNDTIAKPDSPVNGRIARNLGARLIRVEGADHESVLARVASGDTTGFVDITPE